MFAPKQHRGLDGLDPSPHAKKSSGHQYDSGRRIFTQEPFLGPTQGAFSCQTMGNPGKSHENGAETSGLSGLADPLADELKLFFPSCPQQKLCRPVAPSSWGRPSDFRCEYSNW